MKIPFSKPIVMSVLAFVAALGSYGGYSVFKNHGKFGFGFDNKTHIVSEIVDGDTIVVDKGVRVRLLGIDAPEKGKCFDNEATDKLAELVAGNELELRKDESGEDNYGRLLRYVFVKNDDPSADNLFVNVEMVRGGFARVMYVKPNKMYLARLQSAEREARADGVGMWGACEFGTEVNAERQIASDPYSEECVIKGNINKRFEKDYFLPGCPNYKRVKVDPRMGEKWFCSEVEAKKAGWKMSSGCKNIHQFR